jgi:hypothetical protein
MLMIKVHHQIGKIPLRVEFIPIPVDVLICLSKTLISYYTNNGSTTNPVLVLIFEFKRKNEE